MKAETCHAWQLDLLTWRPFEEPRVTGWGNSVPGVTATVVTGNTGVFSRRSVAGDSTPRGTNSSRGATYGQNLCMAMKVRLDLALMERYRHVEQAWQERRKIAMWHQERRRCSMFRSLHALRRSAEAVIQGRA